MRRSFVEMRDCKLLSAAATTRRETSLTLIAKDLMRTSIVPLKQRLESNRGALLQYKNDMFVMLAALTVAKATNGSVPMFIWDERCDDEHMTFSKELVKNSILQFPFDALGIKYNDKLDDMTNTKVPSCVIFMTIPMDVVVDGFFKSGDHEAALRSARIAFCGNDASTFSDGVIAVSASNTAAMGWVIDGIGTFHVGPDAIVDKTTMKVGVPRFDLIVDGFSHKDAGANVMSAVHCGLGYIASLISKDMDITAGRDTVTINKARIKRGESRLEQQYFVTVKKHSVTSMGRASTYDYTVKTHWRRGHIRRWPTIGVDGLPITKLIPIPPCIVNADDGDGPSVKDYLVQS